MFIKTTRMKNIIIFILFLSTILSGCKKDNVNAPVFENHLKFKLDNVQIECNKGIYATQYNSLGYIDYEITISGDWADRTITICLNEIGGEALKSCTYTFLPGTDRSVGIGLLTLPRTSYIGHGGGVFNPLVYGSGHITFTGISAYWVTGNFDCALTNSDHTANRVLTDGEFHIKREQ